MPQRPKRPSKRYHHGDLRNALLKTAREVLEERGPSFLNLREISRRVGVSPPSAYHHFPSRDALAVGLVEQGAKEMATFLAVKPGRGKDALVPYGEAYVAFVRANPALYRLMFGEGLTEVSRSSEAVRDFRARAYAIMKSSLAKLRPDSELPTAGLFLWAIMHGLGLLLVDGQIEPDEDPEDLVHRVLQLAGTGLGRRAPRNAEPTPDAPN
jgi:AcrR family transcriptional regulator